MRRSVLTPFPGPENNSGLRGPASVPDEAELAHLYRCQPAQWCWEVCIQLCVCVLRGRLTLALLVARIRADHHDPPMPTDHPALVADRLDARVHLHGSLILFCLSSVACSGSYLYRYTMRPRDRS